MSDRKHPDEAEADEPPYGASAGSVTGVGGAFSAEAAALGVDSGPLRDPVDIEEVGETASTGQEPDVDEGGRKGP
jgi:hypothetical protein